MAASNESRFELTTSRGRLAMALPAMCGLLGAGPAVAAMETEAVEGAPEHREGLVEGLGIPFIAALATGVIVLLGVRWYLRRDNLKRLNDGLGREIPRMDRRIDSLLTEFRAKGEVAPPPDVDGMFWDAGEWPYADIYPETVLLMKEMSDILAADPGADTVLGLVGPTKALGIWWGEHQQYPEDNAKRLRLLKALLFGHFEGTTQDVINRVTRYYFDPLHRPVQEKDVTEAAILGKAAKEHERIAGRRPHGLVKASEEEFALVRILHRVAAAVLRRKRAAQLSSPSKREREIEEAMANMLLAKHQVRRLSDAGNEAVLFNLPALVERMMGEMTPELLKRGGPLCRL